MNGEMSVVRPGPKVRGDVRQAGVCRNGRTDEPSPIVFEPMTEKVPSACSITAPEPSPPHGAVATAASGGGGDSRGYRVRPWTVISPTD